MRLAEDNCLVQAVPADRAGQPLREPVLPGVTAIMPDTKSLPCPLADIEGDMAFPSFNHIKHPKHELCKSRPSGNRVGLAETRHLQVTIVTSPAGVGTIK